MEIAANKSHARNNEREKRKINFSGRSSGSGETTCAPKDLSPMKEKSLCDRCVEECEKRATITKMGWGGTIALVVTCDDYRE